MLRWHILCWQLLWKSILLKLVDLRGCNNNKNNNKRLCCTYAGRGNPWFHHLLKVSTATWASSARREKKKELATLSLEFEYLHRKESIRNADWRIWRHYPWLVFLNVCSLVFASRWLAEIWQLSRRGATGVLEMVFKFQRRSCKLSFLFPPHRQLAAESLLAG